jgi:hypothetical protein
MIDIDKQYTLAGNRDVKVKLSHIDGNIVYGYYHTDDDWQSLKWSLMGGACLSLNNPCYNLVEVKTKIKKDIWISIYPNGVMIVNDNNFQEKHRQILPLDTVYMQVEFNV